MVVEQLQWTQHGGWKTPVPAPTPIAPQLILVFGGRRVLHDATVVAELQRRYPGAPVVGCSTAGEISGTEVHDDSLVATAICFEHTTLRIATEPLDAASVSAEVGARIARALLAGDSLEGDAPGGELRHVLVLSTGIHVNGSALVNGLSAVLPDTVGVTGGLAGDGADFVETAVFFDGAPHAGAVVGIGLYGDRLRVGFGSMGGWDSFGPDRLVTRAEDNVLYELDHEPALALYKRYLGAHAERLPASGLLFPLSLRGEQGQPRVVRTILALDEGSGSLTFAGDIPEGSYARLMKANVHQLVEGAHGAAAACHEQLEGSRPELALLISCVGRKLLLQQYTEEEVESVQSVFGEGTALTGFYSYGEIAPFSAMHSCELHNQTMTITTLSER